MKPYFETKNGKLYNMDCLEMLRQMPENSIDWCITSPPYWGLRDYGVDGQLGNESTPEEYVNKMVEVFREVKRIMADDGVLFLNLGDSYANSGISQPQRDTSGGFGGKDKGTRGEQGYANASGSGVSKSIPAGLKPKDLVGIPWLCAFALRADGWYLRQDIIWHKPNPMPESVTDRCTKSHEYMFLLSKSQTYYFDHEAIKEPFADKRMGNPGKYKWHYGEGAHGHTQGIGKKEWNSDGYITGRNKRSVWTVNTKPNKEAHFATYPEELIIPCVKTSKPRAVILDPFMGSGTTAMVAEKYGRQWLGAELNPDYCAIAAKRIKKASEQFGLFEGKR